jgi:LPXTG-motif cell wall-anchored protein
MRFDAFRISIPTMLPSFSGGYEVLLQVLGPFLGKTGKSTYNWLFIVGLAGSALWLTVTWLRHAEPLLNAMKTVRVADPSGS